MSSAAPPAAGHASPHDSTVDQPAPDTGPRPFTRAQLGWLLAIAVLAAALRLYRLGEWGLWVDEAHTWRDVNLPLWGEGGFFGQTRGWYPISFLVLRGLLDTGLLRGAGEGWLRLPFAFCGIVTVPLLALFGRHLVGRRAALLAALFLAVNPWHIYWSQNARAYVAVVFWAVLAAGTFWLGYRHRTPWLWAVGLASAVAGGLCHPSGLLLLPALAVFPVLERARFRSQADLWTRAVAVVAVVAALAWLGRLLPPLEEFARAKPEASLVHLVQTSAFYFRLPLLLAALLGAFLVLQERPRGRALFLACWTVLPLLTLVLLGSTVAKATARYGLCALPPVILLAGLAAVRAASALAQGLGGTGRTARSVCAALVPAILIADMAAYDLQYFTVQYGDRARWREAASFVTRTAQGSRCSVWTVNEPTMQYYLRPNHFAPREAGVDPHPDREVVAILPWEVFGSSGEPLRPAIGGRAFLDGAIQRARDGGRELFVVTTLPELREIDQNGSLEAALDERFVVARVYPVMVGPKDETIYVFRPAAGR